jgi:hypothetical protein
MSKQREALQVALDALSSDSPDIMLRASVAIREALAEPELEPVAWLSEGGDVSRSKRYMDEMGFICEPLYTAPPARKPLTDSEVFNMAADYYEGYGFKAAEFARAIERAHGIGEA